MRGDRGPQRKLNGRGIRDTDAVAIRCAISGGLQDAEEWTVETVLGIELHNLLDVVWALQQLDPRVERPAVRLEKDLNAFDERVTVVCAEGPTVHD